MNKLLTIGPVHVLVQNQVYALPARACYIFSQGVAPEISNDGSTFAAVPSDNVVAAQFVRSTGTTTQVSLKVM